MTFWTASHISIYHFYVDDDMALDFYASEQMQKMIRKLQYESTSHWNILHIINNKTICMATKATHMQHKALVKQ